MTLSRGEGASRFERQGSEAPLDALRVVRDDAGVCVALSDGGPTIDLVEHLLSAMGALGAVEGLRVQVDGPELPLLDGGAASFAEALRALGFAGPALRRLRVARAFRFAAGASRYELAPASGVEVEVEVDFAHPAIGRQRARWGGDADVFAREIAPARTFGFARDHAALLAAGRARGAAAGPVLVFGDDAPLSEPRFDDEPARHKLLDLVGDMTLLGGPPQGHIAALRPGHRSNLAMMRAALAAGALVRAR